MSGMRLNKFIGETGLCSRREADELIAAGRVTLDGTVAVAGAKWAEGMVVCVDGKEIKASPGQTIMEAAEAAGVYIPRLCYSKDLRPHGSCRVCTCMVNGRPQALG